MIILLDWLGDEALGLDANNCICNLLGIPLGHIVGAATFTKYGEPAGRFANGILYDRDGQVLAYQQGHTGALPEPPPKTQIDTRIYFERPGSPEWSRHDPRYYFLQAPNDNATGN